MAFSATRMLMAASGISTPPPFTVSAASFPGTNYLTTSNTYSGGASPEGILSLWVNFSTINTINYITQTLGGSFVSILYRSSNTLEIFLTDSSGSNSLDITSTVSISPGTWYNILASWNCTGTVGSRIFNLYINGSMASYGSDGGSGSTVNIDYNMQYAVAASRTGIDEISGCISEYYFAPGQFLDFTVSGNRAKFYNSGSPVNLGSSGQTPTGTSPAIYWKGIYTDFNNLGSMAGTMTLSGGSISNCGSTP